MRPSRRLRMLYRSGWEFWLPLPLVALLVWLTGNLIAAQVFSRSARSIQPLQADLPLDLRLSVTVLAMIADIDRQQGITTVSVKTSTGASAPQTYRFATVQASQVEAAMAHKLGLDSSTVRQLISYRILD